MKKVLFLFVALFALLPLFGQEIEPPTSWVDLIGNLDVYLGALGGLAAASVFITGAFNGLFNITKSWVRQLVSWLVPIVIAVIVGNFLNVGFLAEEPFFIAILYGLGAGLVSNGLFDVGFVNTLIKWIEGLINPQKE